MELRASRIESTMTIVGPFLAWLLNGTAQIYDSSSLQEQRDKHVVKK